MSIASGPPEGPMGRRPRPQIRMLGKIAIEEAIILPDDDNFEAARYATPGFGDALSESLKDIHGKRLKTMDDHNVEMMVLSLTSPGIQGITDPKKAEAEARKTNDYMAKECSKDPKRFAGFATLSMHDPKAASQELKRAVTDLGLKGALINDFQSCGDDGEGQIYYDQPDWDPFWQTVQDLDTVFYIHPRMPAPHIMKSLWRDRQWLAVASLQFAQAVSRHTLGIAVNGVFDRFPGVKVVIGHMGEGIPQDLWRMDHFNYGIEPYRKNYKGQNMPMKRTIREYFARGNLWLTTSGHFSTPALHHAMIEVGADRMMFSIDYPYEYTYQGADWWDNLTVNPNDKVKMGRNNAIKLLKLDLPLKGPEAVCEGLERLSM